MNTYISMLRGINVSGQKKIKMDDLKTMYEELGLEGVATYIQSGNVVFRCKRRQQDKLETLVEKALQTRYGFDVPVQIRSADEWEKILAACPFDRSQADAEGNKYHITFLNVAATRTAVAELQQYLAPGEQLIASGRELYFHCPGSYGKTKLSNNFIEKRLNITATSRNWKTVTKLYEMTQAGCR